MLNLIITKLEYNKGFLRTKKQLFCFKYGRFEKSNMVKNWPGSSTTLIIKVSENLKVPTYTIRFNRK